MNEPKPRIVTAQPFFNELDLLELKVRELEGVVDAHVIVESGLTFTGLRKPLHFLDNAGRFTGIPIFHRAIDLPHEAPSPWDREGATHRALLEVVREIEPEIVIWVDADELPRRSTVERFLELGVQTATLDMDVLLFGFDRLDLQERWRKATISRWHPGIQRQPGRGETGHPVLEDAGWHLEYFGRDLELGAKMLATSHAPEVGAEDMRRRLAAGELPGIERTVRYPDALLPRDVQLHRGRYARHFVR